MRRPPRGTSGAVSSSIASAATRGACAARSSASDVLPARGREEAAVGERVGADLQLAAVRGPRADPGAARDELLRARRALGRRERLALAPRAQRSPGCGRCARRRPSAAQRGLGGEQQRELVLERDVERVDLVGRGPVPARRRRPAPAASPARRAAPRRSPSAAASAASAPAALTSRVAAKPQPPPTRTRTPMPLDPDVAKSSTSPARTRQRLVARLDVAGLGVGAAALGLAHEVGQQVERHQAAS